MWRTDLRLKELGFVLPNVMPPVVEDSGHSPRIGRRRGSSPGTAEGGW